MISLWLGLNLIDLMTTLSALEMGHSEGNPLISGASSAELIAFKVALTVAALVLLIRIKKLKLLKPLCLGMGIVVIWNLVWVIKGG